MYLEGERICLLPISHQQSDTEHIIRWRNQDYIRNRFIDRSLITIQSHKQWLDNMVDSGRVIQFMIYLKVENKPIGSVYLKNIDYCNEKAEFGIFIGEVDCLHKGIGQEAAKMILRYAFAHLHLHKIYLRVFAWNQEAVCCYKKVGFEEEACLEADVKIEEQYYDIILMAVFASKFMRKVE